MHQQAPFPFSCLKQSVAGTPLVKVDAEAGACLTASLRTDGIPRALSVDRRATLERGQSLIRQALREISFEGDARAYFERLDRLAAAVLAVKA
jgi:hypothetical protein